MHSKGKPQGEDDADQSWNWPGCFRHVARCRRLNKEEVVLILSDPLKFGLVRTEVLPEGISNGTVYLCSKDRVRVLKHDGIDYVKRNAAQGSNRIREDVVKMKVNGRHAVNSYSSRGSGSACFWRRRYALEPPAPDPGPDGAAPADGSGSGGGSGRSHRTLTWGDQLVHYLDDEEARGYARRSPFGAAGVARPLTSNECWRGRGAQLPADGNHFLPATRREGRAEELVAAAAAEAAAGVSTTDANAASDVDATDPDAAVSDASASPSSAARAANKKQQQQKQQQQKQQQQQQEQQQQQQQQQQQRQQQQRRRQQQQQQQQQPPSSSSISRTPSAIKQEHSSQQFAARGVSGGGTGGGWMGKVLPGAPGGSGGGDSRFGSGGVREARATAMHSSVWVGARNSDARHLQAMNEGHGQQQQGGRSQMGGGDAMMEERSPMRSPMRITEMPSPQTPQGQQQQQGLVAPGLLPLWDTRKGMEAQQQPVPGLHPSAFADDEMAGGLAEFEGLGVGDPNGSGASHNDDDMSELFRSFLADGGEDLLTASSQGHLSGGGSQSSFTPPSGFLLRVNGSSSGSGGGLSGGLGSGSSSGGRFGVGGGGYDGNSGIGGVRRHAGTSPDYGEMSPGSTPISTQGLRISDAPFLPISPSHLSHSHPNRPTSFGSGGLLPTQVGSPPCRGDARRTLAYGNNGRGGIVGGGVTPSSTGHFLGSHGSTGGGGASECHASGPLQLSSPWSASSAQQQQQQQQRQQRQQRRQQQQGGYRGFGGGPSSARGGCPTTAAGAAVAAFSSSPGVLQHEGREMAGVPAAGVSPPSLCGGSGGGGGVEAVKVVEFSPTWDYAPGGAKLLICLAAPISLEAGTQGPLVYFADRPVQSEMVSQTVLRCRVPPGPGVDGTGRVVLRVEVPSRASAAAGLRRTNSTGCVAFDLGSHRGGGGGSEQQELLVAGVGVNVFEYRCPVSSPCNSAPTISRGGTPRTPAKRLTWQEPEGSAGQGLVVRKREWGEVASGMAAAAAPTESACSSPMPSSSSAGWGQHGHRFPGGRHPNSSSTPRERETPSWGFSSGGGSGKGDSADSGGADRLRRGRWRRASADLGQTARAANAAAIETATASESEEDSLGYPLLPCDGRECKIRIVERLGEIKGSRAASAAGASASGLPPLREGSNSTGGAVEQFQGMVAQYQASSGRAAPSPSASGRLVLGDGGGGAGSREIDDTELNELGDSELESLLEQMWMQVMGQLTDLESELNALDTRGYSVLHYTCLHNLGALVPVLLERGADANLRTGDGQHQTPLHLAARAKGPSIGIVRELVKKGAMVDAVDVDGLTADKLATRCNKQDVALWLWAKSPGAAAANADGRAALRQASPPTPSHPLPWSGGISPARGACPPSPCPPPSPWGASAAGAGEGWFVVGGAAGSSSLLQQQRQRQQRRQQLQQQPPASTSPSPRDSQDRTPPHRSASGTPPPDPSCGRGGSADMPPVISPGWRSVSPGSGVGIDAGKVASGGGIDAMGGNEDEAVGPGSDAADRALLRLSLGGIPSHAGGSGGVGGCCDNDDDMEDVGECQGSADEDGQDGSGAEEGEDEVENGRSTERLLQDAFENLSLHEKCALSLHVSQQQQQQQESSIAGRDTAMSSMDASELSAVSRVLAGGQDAGLREKDLQAIMSMMGPSDLSDVEDEVKVIQQNVRAWILRCNYKSLRKAAKTLQVAWRERQKHRVGEGAPSALASPTSLPPLSSLHGIGGFGAVGTGAGAAANAPASDSGGGGGGGLALDGGSSGGPEPMDETTEMNHHSGGNGHEASGAESCGGGGGSDAGVAGAAGTSLGVLALGGQPGPTAKERATREERAAKALQTAARVMLARKGKGRYQRLARETHALLLIQKRSREWLGKQKQGVEEGTGGGGGKGAGSVASGVLVSPYSSHHL